MKIKNAATFAAVAGAATPSAYSSAAPSYSTITYVECTGTDVTQTTTNTITSTYCGLCENMSTQVSAGQTNYVTAYTTMYTQVCPTGYTEQTYTITESCPATSGATPSFHGPSSGYVPEGFTTAYVPCSVCEETPVTKMMTYPITQGPTVTPAPATTPAPVSMASGNPAPMESACETCEAESSGGAAPVATPAGSVPAAESYPASPAAAASTPAGYVPSPNEAAQSTPVGNSTAGLTPYEPNSAMSLSAGVASLCAVVIGVLAFVL